MLQHKADKFVPTIESSLVVHDRLDARGDRVF